MHLGPDMLRDMWLGALLRDAFAALFRAKGGTRRGANQ
jgi:hypothetical protein